MYKLKYYPTLCITCKNCQTHIPGCLDSFINSPGLCLLISETNYRHNQAAIFNMIDECPEAALTIEFY